MNQVRESNDVIEQLLALPVSDDDLSVLAARPASGSPIAQRVERVRLRLTTIEKMPMDYGHARRLVFFFRTKTAQVKQASTPPPLSTAVVVREEPNPPRSNRESKDDKSTVVPLRKAWDDIYRLPATSTEIDTNKERLRASRAARTHA